MTSFSHKVSFLPNVCSQVKFEGNSRNGANILYRWMIETYDLLKVQQFVCIWSPHLSSLSFPCIHLFFLTSLLPPLSSSLPNRHGGYVRYPSELHLCPFVLALPISWILYSWFRLIVLVFIKNPYRLQSFCQQFVSFAVASSYVLFFNGCLCLEWAPINSHLKSTHLLSMVTH